MEEGAPGIDTAAGGKEKSLLVCNSSHDFECSKRRRKRDRSQVAAGWTIRG